MKKSYKSVEVVVNRVSNELGDFTHEVEDKRGTTLSKIRHQPRLIQAGPTTKSCLANLVLGLSEATTIVHIPMTTPKGEKLTMTEWQQAFWFACDRFGVPMWTQSGIKAHTFEMVRPEMAEKLMSKWDLAKDGARFAAYGGLLFSETDDQATICAENANVAQPDDGQDGNSLWQWATSQFRAMILDVDGLPMSIFKGIGVNHHSQSGMDVNSTQVKFGNGLGDVLLLRNRFVGCRQIRMWISAEPIIMLKDNAFVRNFLANRVKIAVGELLSLLTEERRADLLAYLGSLKLDETTGEFRQIMRAVEEALRSNLPWCEEIETRVTRFAIRMITDKIIPSGGIQGIANLMVISDKHGTDACTWDEAKVIAFRIPVTGANAIIPLPKNPYVKGKGNVVTANVARLASGDADGDLLTVIDDPEIVELFRKHLNHALVSNLKPEKSKANCALNADTLTDIALKQVGNGWMVGAFSVGGWKMAQIGDFETASELLDLANVEPMTYKHNIEFDGIEFGAVASKKYGAVRDALKKITLNWRQAAKDAQAWKSPREMVGSSVAVQSHLDCCWNAGVEAAQAWNATNPLKPLSLSAVARIAFGERGQVISGSEWREAREMISKWAQYWQAWRELGSHPGVDHSSMFKSAMDWAHNASRGAIAAMLVWRPLDAESTGFNLKWHTVFAGGRATDVLGYHPQVAERIKVVRDRKSDLERQVALVDAVLVAIQ